MDEGFAIEITNSTNKEQLVKLFTEGGLPEGVFVFVNGGKHFNYLSYLNMARTKKLKGTSINTEEKKIDVLNIHNQDGCISLPFNLEMNNLSIDFDGFSNYISITVPANSNLHFHLK